MLHRVKKPNDIHEGKWNGLGGKLNPGETPEECARREIREESGLEVEKLTWKGLLTFPMFAHDEDWYAFVFIAQAKEGELIESLEGDLCWIDDEKIADLPLWEGDPIFLPWLDRRGFFSAKFNYVNGKFIDYCVDFYD